MILKTVPDAHAVTVLATDAHGDILTVPVAPDTSWRDAIARYDSDVASGVISFDSKGFASNYPGKAQTDAALGAFYAGKVDAL